MPSIKILGADPAFANFGMALVEVDLDTLEMTPLDILLIETEKSKNKTVRLSSDKLVRAKKIQAGFSLWQARASLIVAEIPSGAQSANAAYGFGVAVGVLASHQKPLIEVTPAEAKRAATGYANASKSDMIDWATQLWPALPWIKGQKDPYSPKNEHMADALAIIKAGVQTQAFDNATAVYRSMLPE